MKRKKNPKQIKQRTDILTNKKLDYSQLNRIVFVRKENKLYLDNEHLKQGRSIYFSNDNFLIQKAISKQFFLKKLKSKNIYEEESYLKIISILKGGEDGKRQK